MNIQYVCETGSSLYGLTSSNSDKDSITIYKADRRDLLEARLLNKSLRYYDNIVDKDKFNKNTSKAEDRLYMDVATFVDEVFNGSPNALELLYSTKHSIITKSFDQIRTLLRDHVELYNFYMLSFLKMNKKYKRRYKSSGLAKNLYHVIRTECQIRYFLKYNRFNYSEMYMGRNMIMKQMKSDEGLKYIDIDELAIQHMYTGLEMRDTEKPSKVVVDKIKKDIVNILMKYE